MEIFAVLLLLLRQLIVSIAFGVVFVNRRVFLAMGVWVNFLIGATLSPFFIALFDYVIGFIWVGAPTPIFWWVPLLTAVGCMCFSHPVNVFLCLCTAAHTRIKTVICTSKPLRKYQIFSVILMGGMFVIFLFRFVPAAYYTASSQTYGTDYCHYLTQASYFAEDKKSLEIDSYSGEKEGTVLPDDHGALWSVYLADAYLHSPQADYPYQADLLPNTAAALTYFGFLLSMIAVCYAVGRSISFAIFAPVVLMLYRYSGLALSGSREGFRFIPLLATLLLCVDLMVRVKKEPHGAVFSPRGQDYFFVGLLFFFSMQGHGGNLFALVGLAIVALIVCVCNRVKLRYVLGMAAAAGLGTILVFVKNAQFFLRFGSFRFSSYFITKGTILATARAENGRELSLLSTIMDGLTWLDILFFVSGVLCTLLLLLGTLRQKNRLYSLPEAKIQNHSQLFFSLFASSILLPLSGLYNLVGENVALWFIMQIRYRMVFYVVFGVSICAYFAFLCARIRSSGLRIVLSSLLALCALLGSLFQMTPANYWADTTRKAYIQGLADELRFVAEFSENQAGTHNVVAMDQMVAHYFKTPPKFIITFYCQLLIRANSTQEIQHALAQTNTSVFLFHKTQSWPGAQELPLYNYLKDKKNATLYEFSEAPQYEIFVLNEK